MYSHFVLQFVSQSMNKMLKLFIISIFVVHFAVSSISNSTRLKKKNHSILSKIFQTCQINIVAVPNIPTIRTPVGGYWDDDTQSLYFAKFRPDEQQSSIFRYSYRDGVLYSARIEGFNSVSFILPAKQKCCKTGDLFVVATGSQVFTIKWDGLSNQAVAMNNLFTLDANLPMIGVAAARTDPRGRFYGGTLFNGFCSASNRFNLSFYRYDIANGLTRLFGGLKVSIGTAFNEKARKMYHLELCQLKITEFDWDPATGDICNFDSVNEIFGSIK